MKLILVLILLLSASLLFGSELYLLTDSLQFSNSVNLKPVKLFPVTKNPTIFKKISEENGVMKLFLIEEDGKTKNETLYISSKSFALGATSRSSLIPFMVDPNKVIQNVNFFSLFKKKCPPEDEDPKNKTVNKILVDKGPCDFLSNKDRYQKEKEEIFITCFESIRNKLNFKIDGRGLNPLAKLYSFPKEQQIFMAQLLTMLGEARGTTHQSEQMAAVLHVIENRTSYAQKKHPDPWPNQLDIVLQNAQFSMYNSEDLNWKHALLADTETLKKAIAVLINPKKFEVKSKHKLSNTIYHFVTEKLCHQKIKLPNWAINCKDKIPLTINNVSLGAKDGHVFFADIPWSFNPVNRYKLLYAQTMAKESDKLKRVL